MSECAKYAVYLTTANQYTDQLSREILASISGNVGTIISFRLGEDSRRLAPNFAGFQAEDLMALDMGQALVRIGNRNHACLIHTFPSPPKPEQDFTAVIKANSRKLYARPRAEVEAPIKGGGTVPTPAAKIKRSPNKKRPRTAPPSLPDLDDLVN